MENLRILLVDDEELARRGLFLRLEQLADVEIIGECANGREALASISALDPDLVFLDIQMPGIDGFDVVRSLQEDNMPAIVFVTAFDQYAIKAFDVHAVDYILKPADDQHLLRALERVRRHKQGRQAISDKDRLLAVIETITGKIPSELADWLGHRDNATASYPEKLTIRDNHTITMLPVAEIDWIDAAGDYMCVHAGEQVHVLRMTMKKLECQLNPSLFQRIHRSTIVNVKRVQTITPHMNGEYHLRLAGGARLKMSRNYKNRLQKLTRL